MKHAKFIIKILCFVIIVGITLKVVDTILIPKYLYDNDWPTTQTFTDFYDLDDNSIDVLFFGSSHGASSFTPLGLYEDYGIRSYNLSSEQQNLLISYYWLKEALRFQSPKAVILDTYILFEYKEEEPLNSAESTQRKAIDYMKWSAVKREAVRDICKYDENQTLLSYYLPNLRFHTRWTGLNEDDFTYDFFAPHKALMGYSALNNRYEKEFEPFKKDPKAGSAEPVEVMQEYLDRIVELCNSKDIDLILVKTPSTVGNIEKYNYLDQYARENRIKYIDFNEASVYKDVGYDFANDNHDSGHLNLWGATKVTDYLGKVLLEEYKVSPVKSDEHEKLLSYYASIKKDCGLKYITDIYEYLDAINDERYAVFISVKDEGFAALDDRLKEKLSALGTTVNFDDKYRYSYYVVINGDEPNEKISDEELESEGTIRNGKVIYSISSAGYDVGNSSSIKIAKTEYSKNKRGMNFVIYCLDTKKEIDAVTFDTHEELEATR